MAIVSNLIAVDRFNDIEIDQLFKTIDGAIYFYLFGLRVLFSNHGKRKLVYSMNLNFCSFRSKLRYELLSITSCFKYRIKTTKQTYVLKFDIVAFYILIYTI